MSAPPAESSRSSPGFQPGELPGAKQARYQEEKKKKHGLACESGGVALNLLNAVKIKLFHVTFQFK